MLFPTMNYFVALLTTEEKRQIKVNLFHAYVPFLYSQKTLEFPTFSGRIKMEHWREMD